MNVERSAETEKLGDFKLGRICKLAELQGICKLADSKPGPGVPQRSDGGVARGVVEEAERLERGRRAAREGVA